MLRLFRYLCTVFNIIAYDKHDRENCFRNAINRRAYSEFFQNPPKFLQNSWTDSKNLVESSKIFKISSQYGVYWWHTEKKTNIASPLGQRAWKVYGYPRLVCVDILRFQQLIKILYFTYFIYLFGLILWCSMLDVHIYQFLNM